MNRLKDMREGSVKVRIEGRGMERFFNIAAQRGITITEIETKETKKARKAGSVGYMFFNRALFSRNSFFTVSMCSLSLKRSHAVPARILAAYKIA